MAHRLAIVINAMGGKNSPDIAQLTHVGLLHLSQVVDIDKLLEYGKPILHSEPLIGVMYDDLVVITIWDDGDGNGPGRDRDLVHGVLRTYQQFSLDVSEQKCFGHASSLADDTQCSKKLVAWGTEVSSRPGSVAAESSKLITYKSLVWIA